MTRQLTRQTALGLAIGVLVMAGCGVADYEKKMATFTDRVQRFEEAASKLDGPLGMPQSQDPMRPGSILNFYLRPPRGITSLPSNEKDPRNRLLYTYSARAQNAAAPFYYVEIAGAPLAAQDFEANVMACFTANAKPVQRQRMLRPLRRSPLAFTCYEFEDGSYFYSVNFFKNTSGQVVVVYWAAVSAKSAANRIIDASLETFGLELEANVAREAQTPPMAVPPHSSR